MKTDSYIRYGETRFIHYKDVGALHKIDNKVGVVSHCDRKVPKSYGRMPGAQYGPGFYETINDIKYEIPHESITAKKHLELKKRPVLKIQYISEHDVALLYVEKELFNNIPVDTLEMKNPTLSVKLMLEHNKDLFGFKYVLIGQETLDLIKSYAPEKADKNYDEFSGFQKIIKMAGLALDPVTLHMLKIVDSAIDNTIPDEILTAKNKAYEKP